LIKPVAARKLINATRSEFGDRAVLSLAAYKLPALSKAKPLGPLKPGWRKRCQPAGVNFVIVLLPLLAT